jgi:hypothetical protein
MFRVEMVRASSDIYKPLFFTSLIQAGATWSCRRYLYPWLPGSFYSSKICACELVRRLRRRPVLCVRVCTDAAAGCVALISRVPSSYLCCQLSTTLCARAHALRVLWAAMTEDKLPGGILQHLR